MTSSAPVSPCINICSLDEQGVCRGCYRSREEIAAWVDLTPARQWQVLRASEARRLAGQQSVAG